VSYRPPRETEFITKSRQKTTTVFINHIGAWRHEKGSVEGRGRWKGKKGRVDMKVGGKMLDEMVV
jgi:hypothetical protein